MSWQDNIHRWRSNVKAGAPAAPSNVGSPASKSSSSLYARSRSAPPPSDAMTSISRRPPNPRAAPDPLPQYGGPAYPPRQAISRPWDRRHAQPLVASPSPSRSRSRSSGTPPAPAPGARRYAPQPGPGYGGAPRPVVPLVPVLPVSPPAVVHVPAQQHLILVQSPPPSAYYAAQPLSSTGMATAGSPPNLGASPCPECHRSVPTLELRSHLARAHRWRV